MSDHSPANKGGPPEASGPTYSEELFGKGIYARHHLGRFEWLRRKFEALADQPEISVLEVGCHDGRALSYIPQRVRRYAGFDAGWGGGLERGRQRFATEPGYSFTESTNPRDVESLTEDFDFIICMETLEHLNTAIVEQYIQAFAAKLRGYLLITVPNEKGIPFLVKATGARILGIDRYYPYETSEFFWAVLGRVHRVRRIEHKGFDYALVVNLIRNKFKYVSVEGISPLRLPPSLSLTIGIVASQKALPRGR
jgi:2-polyprenyl-3-methyl-5-hydroxy-6-metoxy-1,4-benzoquinol methylase